MPRGGQGADIPGGAVINDIEHAVSEAYLRLLADQMGLRDWDIDLAREYADDPETGAECRTTYGRKCATIVFGQAWFDNDPETQRYYCVHELLHCHTQPIHTALQNLHGRIGADSYEIIKGVHQDAMEYAIDGIGVGYAKFLPLPPRPEDDEELPANVVRLPVEKTA